MIFTTWKPLNAIWGAYLFGMLYWLYMLPAGCAGYPCGQLHDGSDPDGALRGDYSGADCSQFPGKRRRISLRPVWTVLLPGRTIKIRVYQRGLLLLRQSSLPAVSGDWTIFFQCPNREKWLLTVEEKRCKVSSVARVQFYMLFSYSEWRRVHRTCETTATPMDGRCQPERRFRTIRGYKLNSQVRLIRRAFCMQFSSAPAVMASFGRMRRKKSNRRKGDENGKKTFYFRVRYRRTSG